MKRKILIFSVLVALVCCFMAMGISAATTNEFGAVEALDNIDLSKRNKDMNAKMVIKAKGEYHTYPSSYVLLDNKNSLYFDFGPISTALGETVSKESLIRFEVPSNITSIPYGGLASCANLLEIKFLDDSNLETVGGGGFYNNPLLEKINLPASLKEFTGTQIFNQCYALHTVTFAKNSQLVKIPDYCFQKCKSLKKVVLPHSVTTLGNNLFDSATVLDEFYLSPNLVDFGKDHFAWKQSGTLKIFAPAQLFANKETVGLSDFSWYDKCLPSMVIFFTGTKEQADAIVGKSTYNRLTNATVTAWDPDKTTDDYVPENGWTIVYGYGVCDAFFGGEHTLTGVESVKVIDFFTEIKVGDMCTRQGCGVGTVRCVIAPIFENLGFSQSEMADENGKYSVTLGYKINYEAYESYLEYGELDFGFVVAANEVVNGNALRVENGVVVPVNDRVFVAEQGVFAYDYVDFKVIGIDSSNNGKELIMSMYTYDGKEIKYLNENLIINV